MNVIASDTLSVNLTLTSVSELLMISVTSYISPGSSPNQLIKTSRNFIDYLDIRYLIINFETGQEDKDRS